MTRRGPIGALVRALLAAALGCGSHAAPPVRSTRLGGDAAQVGDAAIAASLVVEVARSRGVESQRALDGLIEDALLALEARTRGLDRDAPVRWASMSALARAVSERLLDDARRRGVPTDDELATIRVIHAVVLRSPALWPFRGQEIADDIQQAVAAAKSEDEFETRARRIPHADAKVRIERIEAFDASGRSARGEVLDASFVAGAFELHARGETSIVASPFGWHVVRLIERVPCDAAALEQRRQELAADVLQMRAREQIGDLLETRRRREKLEVSSAANDLMAKVADVQ